MRKVISIFLAISLALSLFGVVSNAEGADFRICIDYIWGINGAIEESAYVSHGDRNAIAEATVNVLAGSGIAFTGWLVADVGVSKLQYSIEGGAWQDVTGTFTARTDLPSVDFLSDFDFTTVNTKPGIDNFRITNMDALTDGANEVLVRAVPKDGSVANAYTVMKLNVNVQTVFDATDLIWFMGNQNGEGACEYTAEGFSSSKPEGHDTPWPSVNLGSGNGNAGGVKPSIYPYAVVGVKSDGEGHIDPYSLGTLKALRSATEPDVTPVGLYLTQEVKYFILDIYKTELDIIPSLTFPYMGTNGPVVFTKLAFFHTKEEAVAFAFPYDIRTQTNVDYMTVNNLTYGPKAQIDWLNYDWADRPETFRDAEASSIYGIFHGWLASNHVVSMVGYQIDDQDPVFSESFGMPTNEGVDAATAVTRGTTGTSMPFVITFPIIDGTHTVKIVAKLQNSATPYTVFSNHPRSTYTYTNVESGIKSAQILLGDTLCLSVKAVFPDGTADPALRVTDADGKVTDLAPVRTSGSEVFFEYDDIYPQLMTMDYNLVLLNGNEPISGLAGKDFSVADYADTLYNSSAAALGYTADKKAALDILLADLLTYGAQAQIYKSFKTGDLADELAWVDAAKTPADTYEPVSVKRVNKASEFDRVLAATLVLDNTIRFKVKVKASSATAVKFSYGDGESVTVPAADWEADGDSFIVFSEPVMAGFIDSAYVIDLIDSTGNVLASVTYSVESYIASGVADPVFMDALLNYGKSAAAFQAA